MAFMIQPYPPPPKPENPSPKFRSIYLNDKGCIELINKKMHWTGNVIGQTLQIEGVNWRFSHLGGPRAYLVRVEDTQKPEEPPSDD